jgi:hypothetical protein
MLRVVPGATDPNLGEALSLLRDHHMEQCRQRGRKDDAAKQLFVQLQSLSGKYELEVHERHRGEWNDLVVLLRPAKLQVSYLRELGVRVARHGEAGDGAEVVLDYDGEGKCFVGREPDLFRTPVPGEPIQRRAAIALLMETIIAVARNASTR